MTEHKHEWKLTVGLGTGDSAYPLAYCRKEEYAGPLNPPEPCDALMGGDSIERRLNAFDALVEAAGIARNFLRTDRMERYEELADAFYRDTLLLAPGKDVPPAAAEPLSYKERMAKWHTWNSEREERQRQAVDAALALARGDSEVRA